MRDAVLMAKHCNRDMFFRSERPPTPSFGGLDVGSATIGCLLSTLAATVRTVIHDWKILTVMTCP
jgi:hypothetical protein